MFESLWTPEKILNYGRHIKYVNFTHLFLTDTVSKADFLKTSNFISSSNIKVVPITCPHEIWKGNGKQSNDRAFPLLVLLL